jgi:hypothetical protein
VFTRGSLTDGPEYEATCDSSNATPEFVANQLASAKAVMDDANKVLSVASGEVFDAPTLSALGQVIGAIVTVRQPLSL